MIVNNVVLNGFEGERLYIETTVREELCASCVVWRWPITGSTSSARPLSARVGCFSSPDLHWRCRL